MLIIRNHNKELIIDSLNLSVCQTVFHRQCSQITSTMTGRFSTCLYIEHTVFVHVTQITGMQPYHTVLMGLQSFCRCFRSIISQHKSRTADANFTHLMISKFFLCARFKNAYHVTKGWDSNITISHRMRRQRKGHIGACLTASISSSKPCITVMSFQKLLCIFQLLVIICLTSNSSCQKV